MVVVCGEIDIVNGAPPPFSLGWDPLSMFEKIAQKKKQETVGC